MTDAEREAWLAERKLGIGGSDLADLFEDPPFGCKRKLYYDKADIEPDYEKEAKHVLDLGRDLEDPVARYYEERYGRVLEMPPTPSVMDPQKPWRRASPDRMIVNAPENDPYFERLGSGVAEIKTVHPFYFRWIQVNAAKLAFLRQVTWTGVLANVRWGTIPIFCRGTGDILPVDLEFDPAWFEQMGEAVDQFWHDHVLAGVVPEPLESLTDACFECPWRRRCRGTTPSTLRISTVLRTQYEENLDPELDNETSSYVVLRSQIKALDEEGDQIKERIKEYLTERDAEGNITYIHEAVRTLNGGKITWKPQVRSAWDGKALEKLAPVVVSNNPYAVAAAAKAAGLEANVVRLNEQYKLTSAPKRVLLIREPKL